MADIKYLKGVKVAATQDGSGIILAGATESEGVFTIAFQAEQLGRIIHDLMRLAVNPNVAKHAPAKPPLEPGGSGTSEAFRLEALSVARVPIVPGTLLSVDLPGMERFALGPLSLEESGLLSQQLQEAVRTLQPTGARRLN
jgi:hypothetical protein